jgi:polysaccharide pyruvyl transferase WcaK-like protein
MLRQESASVERALFGTGVRSPEYWGVTEPMDDWFSFIDSALFAAVRGPDSVQNLRTLGYGRDLPIIGDPALFLDAPEGSQRVEGRIVVCPVYTSGNLHGGSDDVVFDALARLIEKSRADGREIVMLSAFPQDDRWVIDIMRRAFAPDLPYVAGYEDIDATMGLLASAEVVIGERLHAAIMAAAAGTPFVGLEYRPKMRDFARSVGQEDAVIRTDEMERLDEVFDRVVAEREARVDDLGKHVSDHRARQAEAASDLRRRFLGR